MRLLASHAQKPNMFRHDIEYATKGVSMLAWKKYWQPDIYPHRAQFQLVTRGSSGSQSSKLPTPPPAMKLRS